MSTPKNEHAVILGRQGGKARTEAKARASRENGKKGGRPKIPDHHFDTCDGHSVAVPIGRGKYTQFRNRKCCKGRCMGCGVQLFSYCGRWVVADPI